MEYSVPSLKPIVYPANAFNTQFRGNWTVDPKTGEYHSSVPSPTNIPSDPPLAAYGVHQAEQLATALLAIKDPPITRVYSSPFYRCLQTLKPFVEKSGLEVRGDNGIGEWYGLATSKTDPEIIIKRFRHPSPASSSLLRTLFGPSYHSEYKPSIIPSSFGEDQSVLHDRCSYALSYIISDADVEDAPSSERHEKETSILICSHAATIIAISRALTGYMPYDFSVEDFKAYTCGISKFVRRKIPLDGEQEKVEKWVAGMYVPKGNWKDGKGVAGGWDCEVNSNCDHLEGGEERPWRFHGDEMFCDPDAWVDGEHGAEDSDANDKKGVANPKL